MYLLFTLLGVLLCLNNWLAVLLIMCLSCLVSITMIPQYSWSMMSSSVFSSSATINTLIWLTMVISFLSILASSHQEGKIFFLLVMSIALALTCCFLSSKLIYFFIFFEITLIPTLMLIIGFGYQPERLMAGTYMIMYTILLSIPLLMLILWRMMESSTNMVLCLSFISSKELSSLLFIFLTGAFLVKLPLYGSHLWLPKAHVEAPLAGSMILAGVLLKLGGYGIYQMNSSFNLMLLPPSMIFIMSVAMWGGFLAALMCMKQSDMKALVAYSSVAHMGLVAVGYLSGLSWGYSSALILMVAHGVCSSAMFCMAYYSYSKTYSRSLFLTAGLLVSTPMISLYWFILNSINMAAPGTLNLMSEILIMPSIYFLGWSLLLIIGLMVFFSCVYNMYLYTAINHGCQPASSRPGDQMNNKGQLVIVAHILPMLIILKSYLLFS